MKRIISLMLIMLLVLFASGCSQNVPSEEQEIQEEETPAIDMGGYTCKIMQEYPTEQTLKYPQDTLLADAALERMASLSEKYNCSITVEGETSNAYLQALISPLIAGQYFGEIACTHQPWYLAHSDCLYPLTEVQEYLDFTNYEKFGSVGLLELGMANGVPYTVYPILWPERQSSYTYNILAFDVNFMKANGLTDPREYMDQKIWNWDTFEKVLRDYTFNIGEDKIYGLMSLWPMVGDIVYANGGNFVETKEDGTLVNGLFDKKVIEAIDWCTKLFTEYSDCIKKQTDYETGVKQFINNEGVLYHTSFSHLLQSVVYEVDNFGIVPLPCGPSQTYGVWSSIIADPDSTFGIFYNAENPEYAARIINDMLEPFEGFETKEQLKKHAQSVFFDDRDIDFYLSYLDNTRANYWPSGTHEIWNKIRNECAKGVSGTESVQKYASTLDSIIDEYLKPNYEFINSLPAQKN
jgi:ABC-type glycerol-3-phosphate transport system substrate-binding protein